MKLLTKQTDYAVRALLHIAMTHPNILSSRVISEENDIPLSFLRQIIKQLKAQGILSSRKGKMGGVYLLRNPEDISLEELVTIFQGPIRLTECLFRKTLCPNRPTCVLRSRLKKVEEKVKEEFSQITLEVLLRDILRKSSVKK
jgi:Rrf2 family transcriptional regulator, cysteine metabolism repressor